jgi:DNA-binding NarL/FixJ family response regulator
VLRRRELPVWPGTELGASWGDVAQSMGLLLYELRLAAGETPALRTSGQAGLKGPLGLPHEPSGELGAVHSKDRPRVREHILRAASEGRSECEYRLVDDQGQLRWVRSLLVAGCAPDGSLLLRGVIQDVTLQHHRALAAARRHPGEKPLTVRQQQILQLVAEGATAAEIGERLGLSRRTVENHIARTLRGLGARRSVDAVAIARERGWLND